MSYLQCFFFFSVSVNVSVCCLLVNVVVVYCFFCGIRSSMEPSCSKRFSISMSSETPSMTPWTNSTSENPRRSELERSKTPPSAAVSTPPVPRFCEE